MKNRLLVVLLLAPLFATPASAKKALDWSKVEKIPLGAHILVTTSGGTECSLQKVTGDQLFCKVECPRCESHTDRVFDRADIRDVCVGEMEYCNAFDFTAGVPFLLAGMGASGGWFNANQPTASAGVKAGLDGVTLDLQFDRINSKNGLSVEGSGMIPVFRVPPYRREKDRMLFKLYAEPGLGYRVGDGPFGQYASAKVLLLFGQKWVNDGASPYVELQRRFPFNGLLSGDNRITFGVMWAVCEHCGLD